MSAEAERWRNNVNDLEAYNIEDTSAENRERWRTRFGPSAPVELFQGRSLNQRISQQEQTVNRLNADVGVAYRWMHETCAIIGVDPADWDNSMRAVLQREPTTWLIQKVNAARRARDEHNGCVEAAERGQALLDRLVREWERTTGPLPTRHSYDDSQPLMREPRAPEAWPGSEDSRGVEFF